MKQDCILKVLGVRIFKYEFGLGHNSTHNKKDPPDFRKWITEDGPWESHLPSLGLWPSKMRVLD